MSFPNAKELKKLADSCRKAGIKHFKSGDLEFTLADDAPVSNYRKKATPVSKPTSQGQDNDQIVIDDELTQEQLLMWSVMGNVGANEEESVQ